MKRRRDVARLLAGTFLLAAATSAAEAETRALSLINTHTQERATIVFKRDGSYDQRGLTELNHMLRDWRRNEVTRMDPMLFDLVWDVYRRVGSHEPIHIVSGYRSPATNSALRNRSRGVARFSQHMLGKAMDFYLPDVPLSTLRETGMKLQMGGVGFYPTSGSPFVHMDTGSVRAWPRMTREQLVRLFPDGRTAHLPSDGAPLPGYEQALAEAQSRKESGGGPVESSSSGGGLLAALFGGGSSSSSSYSSSRAPIAGDDEEEASAPAPRRQQELRQGPLPGVDPKAARTAPPPAPVAVAVATPTPRPTQVAAAPVPTAVSGGSLVAMPVTGPNAGPTRPGAVAAAQPQPSRYGPAGAGSDNGLPPGWVAGPSGKAVAEERPQQIAFTPGLKPMPAPLPVARPSRGVPEMIAAAVVLPPGVAMPKPRPNARTADAGAGNAHAALSAFTGDDDRSRVALGYADAGAPAPTAADDGYRLASLAQPAPSAAGAARAAPESRFSPAAAARGNGKSDRGAVSARGGKGDRAVADRIWDADAHAEGETFAQMRHPDQNAIDTLFTKPRMSLATGFTFASLELEGSHAFTGPAVVSLPVILTK